MANVNVNVKQVLFPWLPTNINKLSRLSLSWSEIQKSYGKVWPKPCQATALFAASLAPDIQFGPRWLLPADLCAPNPCAHTALAAVMSFAVAAGLLQASRKRRSIDLICALAAMRDFPNRQTMSAKSRSLPEEWARLSISERATINVRSRSLPWLGLFADRQAPGCHIRMALIISNHCTLPKCDHYRHWLTTTFKSGSKLHYSDDYWQAEANISQGALL